MVIVSVPTPHNAIQFLAARNRYWISLFLGLGFFGGVAAMLVEGGFTAYQAEGAFLFVAALFSCFLPRFLAQEKVWEMWSVVYPTPAEFVVAAMNLRIEEFFAKRIWVQAQLTNALIFAAAPTVELRLAETVHSFLLEERIKVMSLFGNLRLVAQNAGSQSEEESVRLFTAAHGQLAAGFRDCLVRLQSMGAPGGFDVCDVPPLIEVRKNS